MSLLETLSSLFKYMLIPADAVNPKLLEAEERVKAGLKAEERKAREAVEVEAKAQIEAEERKMRGSSTQGGRKRNDNLPPNRARDVQRAFRARRAAHLQVRCSVISILV
jgi:hypothetical protein